MSKILFLLFSLTVILVNANDLTVGYPTPYSKKIYSTVKYANPALWRRTDDIMVSAPFHDVISAVFVTDLRSDKEGEAYVEAGGLGSKTVTIALKSPSLLTGYKFAIEVYAENTQYYMTPSLGLQGHAGVGAGAGFSTYPNAQLSGYGSSYSVGYPSANQYPVGKK